jgi:hypothetical protein
MSKLMNKWSTRKPKMITNSIQHLMNFRDKKTFLYILLWTTLRLSIPYKVMISPKSWLFQNITTSCMTLSSRLISTWTTCTWDIRHQSSLHSNRWSSSQPIKISTWSTWSRSYTYAHNCSTTLGKRSLAQWNWSSLFLQTLKKCLTYRIPYLKHHLMES